MTFVIGEPCIDVTDKSCMEVCPVNCIYEVGQDPKRPGEAFMLVIDPEECIDCGACEPECPVEAIAMDDSVAGHTRWEPFVVINAMHEGRGSNDGPATERREANQDIATAALQAHLAIQGG